MLELTERVAAHTETHDTLTLPFELRQKSRQRVRLDSAAEAAIMLPRGTRLRDGDVLRGSDGRCVRIRAAAERLSTARTANPLGLARACYHLGNRHVAVEVGTGWVRYQHDHVLDDMLRGLGLNVRSEFVSFEPEPGAYGGHHHGHGHSHAHTHDPAAPPSAASVTAEDSTAVTHGEPTT